MAKTPKVSVLVPVYNGARYLAECIESVLEQDFADCEILIVDDCSTDDSLALAERYAAKDRRIRCWKNPRNLGLSANFNCCFRAAQGEYIKYVLQDDKLLSPDAVRLMAATLDSDPAISLVGSASYILDAQSRKVELRRYFKEGVMDGRRAILHCLEQPANLIGEPSLTMFRRAQAARGYDERYQHGLDLELWFHLLEQGNFAYLSEPLCAFRKHAEQQSKINHDTGATDPEALMLLEHYYSKPWLREMATRRMLFAQIYSLRKFRDARAPKVLAEMKRKLGRNWYAVFWLRRKLGRPFEKLKRKLVCFMLSLRSHRATP